MPYLTFETETGRDELENAIKIAQKPKPIVSKKDDDQNLIVEYLSPRENCLHVSRTLDQFYHYSLRDTTLLDKKQVVYRYIKDQKDEDSSPDKSDPPSPKFVMVDQLWLWVIDESTVPELPSRAWYLTITLRNDHH